MAGLFSLFMVVFVSYAAASDVLRFTMGLDGSISYMYASQADVVLFDTQYLITDTQRLVYTLTSQVVSPPSVNLRYVVLTSTDPRSFLGLATVAAAFPNASIVATPGVAEYINQNAASIIAGLLAANASLSTVINTVVPPVTALRSNTLQIGSATFTLTEFSQVASAYNTYVWNAASGTLFPGFVHYGLHPDLSYPVVADSLHKYQLTLRNFLTALSPINTLYPRFGLPGVTGATVVTAYFLQTIGYVDDFSLAVESPNTVSQAINTLNSKYPGLQGQQYLAASVNAAIPGCVPSCGSAVCGSDGCGGSCGSCVSPSACGPWGQCECQAQCNGRFCGSDGCGNTCGTCPYGVCNSVTGLCLCIPNCPAGSCGADGCGGVCSCAEGQVCTGALTCAIPTGTTFGLDLDFAGLVTKGQCNQ